MKDGQFLQSPAWEAFQKRVGYNTLRIQDVLVIERTTPLGVYWYIGRADLSSNQVNAIAEQARRARVLFIRIDPIMNCESFIVNSGHNPSRLASAEADHSPFTIHHSQSTQPETTLVLDLQPSTEQLLQSFHEKTRYNIRLAERKGVTVEESSDPEGQQMDDFLALMRKTGTRQGIRAHTDRYYRTMVKVLHDQKILPNPPFAKEGVTSVPFFGERGVRGDLRRNEIPLGPPLTKGGSTHEISTSIVVAYHDGQPLAANLMLWAGDTVYYLHGASDHTQRQLMAPHLLQWACIQRAKERGAQAYDFWGIAPTRTSDVRRQTFGSESQRSNVKGQMYEIDASHPWSGITRFKLGFGGQVVQYPQSVDLVLDPVRYRLYQTLRSIRRAFGRMV